MRDTPTHSAPDDIPAKASALVAALEWLFDRVATAGTSIGQLEHPATDREIDRLIALHTTGAGAAGFVSNLGGLITLPVALPANLAGVAAIQLRLVAAIAAARGYDTESREVRTFALACLAGNGAVELLKKAGIQLGQRLGERAIAGIAAVTLQRINQAVGFQLVAKAGSQGMVNLTRLVPLVGGVVGGSIDAASTLAVGAAAKRIFPPLTPATLPPPTPALVHKADPLV